MNSNNTFQLSLIDNIEFDSIDIADFSKNANEEKAYKLTAKDLADMPEDTKDLNGLRRRLSEILQESFSGNFAGLETECDIKRDTFQRVLRGKRLPSYSLMAKLCVGAKLSMDAAHDLFLLMGYELNSNNKADYVLLCELKNGSDICEYDEDMRRYCNIAIFSSTDSLSV